MVSYRRDERADGRIDFVREEDVHAGVGEAGALIPPRDDHVIENPFDEPAVTLHVYGGEMKRCAVFEPDPDGGYVRREKQLHYTE